MERVNILSALQSKLSLIMVNWLYKFVGDGSYSSVYKVRRVEDGQIYALKKVKI